MDPCNVNGLTIQNLSFVDLGDQFELKLVLIRQTGRDAPWRCIQEGRRETIQAMEASGLGPQEVVLRLLEVVENDIVPITM